MNISNHSYDLDRFSGDCTKIQGFLDRHNLQGLEMIQTSQWNKEVLPPCMIYGLHMRFWPIWLDLWRNNKAELMRQFGDADSYIHYYGGGSRDAIMEYYRNEIKTACDMDADYVVFHVSHLQLEHCYNYRFTYNDDEIIEAFIEMINELLDGIPAEFELLLENQWWPGLTLLDKNIANRLMRDIHYKNKGFMLDIGHLMNTNIELTSEVEAVSYILNMLENLEELASCIKGIHLNSSLSGEYVKSQLKENCYDPEESFFNRYCKVLEHISKIDMHIPFAHPSIKKVIDFVNPKYLVYEFLTESFGELERYVMEQNRVLE
jgi:hypothetical protein